MSNVVSESPDGIKLSLQPHGMKSKVLYTLAAFVVSFGGALAVVSPAEAAAPGDCFVEVSPSPSPSPDPNPTPVLFPTPCSSPSPVVSVSTMTVTAPAVTVTVVKTRIQTVTETETETVTQPGMTPSPSASPSRSTTPKVSYTSVSTAGGDEDSGALLAVVAAGVAGVGGVALLTAGLVGTMRRRRNYQSRHAAPEEEEYEDDDQTQQFEGYPGASQPAPPDATMVIPSVRTETPPDSEQKDETRQLPAVE